MPRGNTGSRAGLTRLMQGRRAESGEGREEPTPTETNRQETQEHRKTQGKINRGMAVAVTFYDSHRIMKL